MTSSDNIPIPASDQEELIAFIKTRLEEVNRLSRSLAVSDALNVQAAVDQLERLSDSVNSVVDFVQHYYDSPLGLPLLKKIANNWSYHSHFNPQWAPRNRV